MVVEELVEGGMTRLAAFYYSKLPGNVGPVRSMRASDIGIVSPAHAVHGHQRRGTADDRPASTTPASRYFTEGAKGFYRDSSRHAPYNLFDGPADSSPGRQDDAERARRLPAVGSGEGLRRRASRPTSIACTSPGGHDHATGRSSDGKYVNENTYAGAGDEFPADTVLVLRVKVGDAGYRDPAGNPVPETQVHRQGPGDALPRRAAGPGHVAKAELRRAARAVDHGGRA